MLARARFEVVPLGPIEDAIKEHLPRGTLLTVTCSPKHGPDRSLDVAERLDEQGYEMVPHLAARAVRSRGHLEELLERIDDVGFRDVFVIGGDGHDPLGPYASAGELLTAMAEIGHGIQRVGIGGYPEGHPLIDDDVLLRALKDKQRLATYMATQICFDVDVLTRWIARIREAGITLPVFVGMAGAVKRRKLLEVSLRVGVGPSLRYLTKYGSIVTRLITRGGYRPDAFVARLAPYVSNPDYGIAGFHIFTFNQVGTTERWRREIMGSYGRARRPIPQADPEDADTA
jgi:methylenetetrahydrofolate reductase (NADPH)